MTAVSFPDPLATNPETGSPYGDGWFNSANGVTYSYDNNVWSAVTEPSSALDDRYVEVAGDDMTGDLTLGTDKIVLNATDGTVTAANVTFNLEPDNSANYTSTTDAEGNSVQVYNGPTLDVKERLESARETFEELKVAVQNATDFGELKAAMMVALEDY